MRTLAVVILCIASVSAFASAPGQPLDCTDWVFLDPMLHCVTYAPLGIPDTSRWIQRGDSEVIDNTGRLIQVFYTVGGRVEIRAFDGIQETLVAYLDPRLRPDGGWDVAEANHPMTFDAVRGRLVLPLNVYAGYDGYRRCYQPIVDCNWIAGIEGFTPLYDIVETFLPDGSVAFRVPSSPEGLRGAEHFDTYVGPVTRPLDLAQAQPLQCGYPGTPPQPGAIQTISTTIPDPAPGSATYVLTAVTFEGNTRAGRRTNFAGSLTGRAASALPACVSLRRP